MKTSLWQGLCLHTLHYRYEQTCDFGIFCGGGAMNTSAFNCHAYLLGWGPYVTKASYYLVTTITRQSQSKNTRLVHAWCKPSFREPEVSVYDFIWLLKELMDTREPAFILLYKRISGYA